MTDVQIASNGQRWGLVLVDGDLVLTHTLGRQQEVAQRVVYEISTWLGESPYERAAGQPYEDGVFGFEPVPGVVALLLQSIAAVEGVDEIQGNPEFTLDDNGLLLIALTIVVDGEDVEIAVTVNP